MNLFVLALKLHVPMRIRSEKLRSLFEATAKAFGTDTPLVDHLPFEERLERYALFTRDEIEKRIGAGNDLQEIRNALYRHACALGSELRKQLRLRSNADVMSVGKALYRSIGIDFEGSSDGNVVVRSCYFGRFYRAEVCHVMSSLDEGIAAGLSAGGRLKFSQRITEGKPCCIAFFDVQSEAV